MAVNRLTEEERQEWANKVKNWETSGKSAAQWCRENKVEYHKFLYWKERFTSFRVKPTPSSVTAFVEIAENKSYYSGITIECHNLRIRLAKQFDLSTLKSLISLLKGV